MGPRNGGRCRHVAAIRRGYLTQVFMYPVCVFGFFPFLKISEYLFLRDFLLKIFPTKVPSVQDYGLMIEDQISNQKKDISFFLSHPFCSLIGNLEPILYKKSVKLIRTKKVLENLSIALQTLDQRFPTFLCSRTPQT